MSLQKAEINFLPMQPGDVKESFANIDHARKYLKYSPKVSINEGIPKFINWYMSYYGKVALITGITGQDGSYLAEFY